MATSFDAELDEEPPTPSVSPSPTLPNNRRIQEGPATTGVPSDLDTETETDAGGSGLDEGWLFSEAGR